jgi:hypothetical protein
MAKVGLCLQPRFSELNKAFSVTCRISVEQNREELLRLVAAASTFYGRAKFVAGIQFSLLVPAALVVSVCVLLKPEWTLWATCYCLTVALLDVLALDRLQTHYRKLGARTQEVFDTTLFGLNWTVIRIGLKPDDEDITRAAAAFYYRNRHLDFIKDWYPPIVGELPTRLASFICQRAACKWDTDLRRAFSIGSLCALAVVVLGVFLIALAGGLKTEDMVLKVYAPIAPAVLWCTREFLRHREALNALERLKGQIESVWDMALRNQTPEAELAVKSREIQDTLFDGRVRHPLIFNWFYRWARRFQEDGMKAKASHMVQEANANGIFTEKATP